MEQSPGLAGSHQQAAPCRAGAHVSEGLGLTSATLQFGLDFLNQEIDFLTVPEPQFLRLQMESVKAISHASCGD